MPWRGCPLRALLLLLWVGGAWAQDAIFWNPEGVDVGEDSLLCVEADGSPGLYYVTGLTCATQGFAPIADFATCEGMAVAWGNSQGMTLASTTATTIPALERWAWPHGCWLRAAGPLLPVMTRPPTPIPATPIPPTPLPPTPVPPTLPPTPVPATPMPPTPSPATPAPPTSAPTPTPPSPAPGTAVPPVLTPPPEVLSMESAASVGGAATSVLSGFGVATASVALSTQASRVKTFMQVASCPPDTDAQELDFMDSPTGIGRIRRKPGEKPPSPRDPEALLSKKMMLLANMGAVVFVLVVHVTLVCLHWGAWCLCRACSGREALRDPYPRFMESMAVMRFPSFSVFPFLALFQPTMSPAFTLLFHVHTASMIAASLGAMAFLCGCIYAVSWRLRRKNFPCVLEPMPAEECWRFFFGVAVWTSKDHDGNVFERMYALLFRDYRDKYRWFMVIEAFFLGMISAVSGAVPVNMLQCVFQGGLLMTIVIVFVLLILRLRPYLAEYDLYNLAAASTLQVAGLAFGLIAIVTESPTGGVADASRYFILSSTALLLVKALADCLVWMYEQAVWLKTRCRDGPAPPRAAALMHGELKDWQETPQGSEEMMDQMSTPTSPKTDDPAVPSPTIPHRRRPRGKTTVGPPEVEVLNGTGTSTRERTDTLSVPTLAQRRRHSQDTRIRGLSGLAALGESLPSMAITPPTRLHASASGCVASPLALPPTPCGRYDDSVGSFSNVVPSGVPCPPAGRRRRGSRRTSNTSSLALLPLIDGASSPMRTSRARGLTSKWDSSGILSPQAQQSAVGV